MRLARRTIVSQLDDPLEAGKPELGSQLEEAVFRQNHGVFVTLHKEGQLRGCIGSLSSSVSIVEGIIDNAINAAFKDYRFPPVTKQEFSLIDLEVSILTEPEPLEYTGADELLAKLHPGLDGVIISKDGEGATFLPQVWKQLPDCASFLSHLCQKAGVGPDQWRSGDLQVKTYRVLCFAEKK